MAGFTVSGGNSAVFRRESKQAVCPQRRLTSYGELKISDMDFVLEIPEFFKTTTKGAI